MTQRIEDTNGWFEVKQNPLSAVGVFPYIGSSIGAPEPDRIYYVLRPPEELSDPEALDSFRLLPLIDEHEMLGGDLYTDAADRRVSGAIGDQVEFRDGKLYGNLKVFSESMAREINEGKTELSLGYRCIYEFTSGVYNGEEYQAVQRRLRGNHIALVEAGRMGKEVAVLDSLNFKLDTKENPKMSKLLKLQKVKSLAKDFIAAMDELEVEVKDSDEVDVNAGDEDEDADKAKKAEDEDDDKAKKAEDETDEEKAEAARLKKAEDEDADKAKKAEDEDDDKAKKAEGMDGLTREVRRLAKENALLRKTSVTMDSIAQDAGRREKLAEKVKPHIGVFNHSGMTFDGACVYVAKKLGLTAPRGQEMTAIDGYLSAKSASVALDSAIQSRKQSNQVSAYLSGK